MPAPSEEGILDAAERVFAEKGFGACSLRDVLTAAECSTTAFYARFASKDIVLQTLIVRLLEDLRDAAVEALPRAKTLADGWDVGIEVLVTTLRDRKGLVKVALSEAGSVEGPREALRDAYAMLAALLEHRLRDLAGRGRIDVADPAALAWAIVGGLTMQLMRWAVFETIGNDELPTALGSTAQALLPKSRRGKKS
jgi:AcrR family transcriptional regulator